METETTTPTQDKQITVDVPEHRVAEFYAFYAHFLAGSRRRGRGHRGHRHGCRGRERTEHAEATAEQGTTPA